MHRAFDQVGDKFEALDALVQLGFDRILTSGGPETATEGIAMLKALQTRAAGRMAIMPGGGVSTINAADILSATGCWQIHGSFRCPAVQDFSLKHFGAHRLVDAEAVAACVDSLRR